MCFHPCRKRNLYAWGVRPDWKEDFMLSLNLSWSSLFELEGNHNWIPPPKFISKAVLYLCLLLFIFVFYLVFFSINAIAPRTKKILQLLRLRQVILWFSISDYCLKMAEEVIYLKQWFFSLGFYHYHYVISCLLGLNLNICRFLGIIWKKTSV